MERGECGMSECIYYDATPIPRINKAAAAQPLAVAVRAGLDAAADALSLHLRLWIRCEQF